MLVWSRIEIFIDGRYNQSFQDFRGWAEKRDGRYEEPWEVSLSGFGIGMINDDFQPESDKS